MLRPYQLERNEEGKAFPYSNAVAERPAQRALSGRPGSRSLNHIEVATIKGPPIQHISLGLGGGNNLNVQSTGSLKATVPQSPNPPRPRSPFGSPSGSHRSQPYTNGSMKQAEYSANGRKDANSEFQDKFTWSDMDSQAINRSESSQDRDGVGGSFPDITLFSTMIDDPGDPEIRKEAAEANGAWESEQQVWGGSVRRQLSPVVQRVISGLEAERSKLQASVQQLEARLEATNMRLGEEQAKVRTLEQQLQDQEAGFEAERGEIVGETEQVRVELKAAEAKIADMEKANQRGDGPVNQLAMRRLALVDELEAKLAEVAGKAQEFKNGMTFWQARAETLHAEASEREKAFEERMALERERSAASTQKMLEDKWQEWEGSRNTGDNEGLEQARQLQELANEQLEVQKGQLVMLRQQRFAWDQERTRMTQKMERYKVKLTELYDKWRDAQRGGGGGGSYGGGVIHEEPTSVEGGQRDGGRSYGGDIEISSPQKGEMNLQQHRSQGGGGGYGPPQGRGMHGGQQHGGSGHGYGSGRGGYDGGMQGVYGAEEQGGRQVGWYGEGGVRYGGDAGGRPHGSLRGSPPKAGSTHAAIGGSGRTILASVM